MNNLKRRWSHLKAAFGPKRRTNVANAAGLMVSSEIARTALGRMGLLGAAGGKPPPDDRGLIR